MNNDEPEIINVFWQANRLSVDAQGIKVPQMVWRMSNGLGVAALMLSPNEIYAHVARMLVRDRPEELVFGMDRWTKSGQGIHTGDCLSVAYWTGCYWRFGVIAYQHEPAIFEPIDWHNSHWTAALAGEMTSAWTNIKAAPHRQPSPAMALPLELVRRCRKCGCTDDDCRQCIEKTGGACSWVAIDLCSACLLSEMAHGPGRDAKG